MTLIQRNECTQDETIIDPPKREDWRIRSVTVLLEPKCVLQVNVYRELS